MFSTYSTVEALAAPVAPDRIDRNLPNHAGVIIGRILARGCGWPDNARRVALVLADYMGQRKEEGDEAGRFVAWPEQSTIAAEANLSKRAVQRGLEFLCDKVGIVRAIACFKARARTSNRYVLDEVVAARLLTRLEAEREARNEARRRKRAASPATGGDDASGVGGLTLAAYKRHHGATPVNYPQPAPATPSQEENGAEDGRAVPVTAGRSATPPPGSAAPPSPAARLACYGRALDAWNARPHLGPLAGGVGRIGKALRAVVEACGAEATLEGFERYLDETTVERPSPNHFATTCRGWVPGQRRAA